MTRRIEDYALVGDCQAAALVSRDGSVDWLCWPRFDSPACLAALLGGQEHGRWRIAPAAEPQRISRRYRPGTLVLETDFECAEGAVRIVDLMPVGEGDSDLVRIVEGRRGRVSMQLHLALRFDYGAVVPWVSRLDDGRLRAIAGPELVVLDAPVTLRGQDLATRASFEVCAGERVAFVLQHGHSHLPPPPRLDAARALASTESFWRGWSGRCSAAGSLSGLVQRSLITLKALTYAPTGGIIAAPTTSLPEKPGGKRNWDYRHCWLRDATLTLLALMGAGYYEEAAAWREWLVRAVAGSPSQVQIMYGLAGERRLPELSLPWLPGFADSRPVRIGNAAAGQLQLDVFGEVMDALHQARRGGLRAHEPSWGLQRALLAYLETIWREPDHGLWEVRSEPRHFTYSRVMCWVAFDRAVRAAQTLGLPGDLERWTRLRAAIHAEICARGFDVQKGAFVQSYGSKELDASALLIPVSGFLPADDARVRATVQAVERELMEDGLVLRYRTERTEDGLPPGEGAFLACSFWLADVYVLQGRLREARALFERVAGLANDVGLLAEEYDTRAGRQLGNFPQAFSHVALVNTALNLEKAEKPAEQRAA